MHLRSAAAPLLGLASSAFDLLSPSENPAASSLPQANQLLNLEQINQQQQLQRPPPDASITRLRNIYAGAGRVMEKLHGVGINQRLQPSVQQDLQLRIFKELSASSTTIPHSEMMPVLKNYGSITDIVYTTQNDTPAAVGLEALCDPFSAKGLQTIHRLMKFTYTDPGLDTDRVAVLDLSKVTAATIVDQCDMYYSTFIRMQPANYQGVTIQLRGGDMDHWMTVVLFKFRAAYLAGEPLTVRQKTIDLLVALVTVVETKGDDLRFEDALKLWAATLGVSVNASQFAEAASVAAKAIQNENRFDVLQEKYVADTKPAHRDTLENTILEALASDGASGIGTVGAAATGGGIGGGSGQRPYNVYLPTTIADLLCVQLGVVVADGTQEAAQNARLEAVERFDDMSWEALRTIAKKEKMDFPEDTGFTSKLKEVLIRRLTGLAGVTTHALGTELADALQKVKKVHSAEFKAELLTEATADLLKRRLGLVAGEGVDAARDVRVEAVKMFAVMPYKKLYNIAKVEYGGKGLEYMSTFSAGNRYVLIRKLIGATRVRNSKLGPELVELLEKVKADVSYSRIPKQPRSDEGAQQQQQQQQQQPPRKLGRGLKEKKQLSIE